MARKLSSDATLFAVTLALLGFGLVMVWSASSAMAQERHGNPHYFVIKQSLWACLGVMAMGAAMRMDYRKLRQPAVIYSALVWTTLLLILVLFMRPVNDTHRWLRLGGLSFQPAELAKLTLILFLAYHLERRADRVNEFLPTLFPVMILLGWLGFLVYIQPDLGSAATLVLIGGVMLFLAGVRLRYFAALAVAGIPLLYQAVMAAAYRRDRIEAFLNPWSDARGSGYQVIQSLIAVGTGGVRGLGIGNGRQKLFFLPEPHTDFIFSIIGEELGFIGAFGLLALFAFLVWRGFRVTRGAHGRFEFYAALGFTLLIGIQALINISVALCLMPTKGLPLPLVSYGGSSLVTSLMSIGILLNLSQQSS